MSSIENYPIAEQVLFDAVEIASIYLPSHQVRNQEVVVHHHHHHHDYWYCGHHYSPSFCSSNSKRKNEKTDSKRKNEKTDEDFALIGSLAFVVSVVSVYFLGANIGSCMNLTRAINSLEKKREDVSHEVLDTACFAKMDEVFTKEKELLNHATQDAYRSLILKTSLLALSTLTFMGAVLKTAAFVQAGVVGAVIVAGVMLYRAGFNSTSKLLEQDARELRCIVRDAHEAFLLADICSKDLKSPAESGVNDFPSPCAV